ncbi:CLUMA_CG007788, isoform A [Clunio marinus]|uniref:CLUMA_CG007788, isoform A n=1 Tax=Clunio marinus TaxID=568069 RepID=A0A1J1I778_9DIPT|nr:CLUMA_CG007788, isoform A [Clunio marinus]
MHDKNLALSHSNTLNNQCSVLIDTLSGLALKRKTYLEIHDSLLEEKFGDAADIVGGWRRMDRRKNFILYTFN